MSNVGQELLNVPFADMVLNLASAIAEGQFKLDQVSCQIAKMMGDAKAYPIYLPKLTAEGMDSQNENESNYEVTSMIGAGFQPTFYQFTDTIIEVKMAITMTKSTESSVSTSAKGGFGCFSASVNASYTSKYSYSVEGSSLLRTKITPVPTNAFMQKWLDLKAQLMMKSLENKFAEVEKRENEIEEGKTEAESSAAQTE